MPTSTVTPTPIPAPGQLLPNPSDLSTWPIRMAEMHRWMRETLSPGVELIGNQSLTNAIAAQEAAVLAYLNANYKGDWSSLTGALNVPSIVSHAGQRWNLLSNLADVTTSTPGVGAEWELFSLPSASGVGFDPSGTSLTATQVQSAIVALSGDVDKALIEFKNPILNGGMRIAQSGTVFPSLTAGGQAIDGWKYTASGTAVVTVQRIKTASPDNQNAYWLFASVESASASIGANDFSTLHQNIEGYDIAEYKGKTFTISFWAVSSVVGVHSLALKNGASDACYIAEFNIATANSPQFFSITITGGLPAFGTWDFTNSFGLQVMFMLAAGSNHYQAAGSWQAANKFVTSSQVNALGTVGNAFAVTAVQINPGTVAAVYRQPNYQDELLRCQRYYEKVDTSFGPTSASTIGRVGFWKVEKRIAPAVSYLNYAAPGSSATCSFAASAGGISKTSFRQSSIGNSGTVDVETSVTGDARL